MKRTVERAGAGRAPWTGFALTLLPALLLPALAGCNVFHSDEVSTDLGDSGGSAGVDGGPTGSGGSTDDDASAGDETEASGDEGDASVVDSGLAQPEASTTGFQFAEYCTGNVPVRTTSDDVVPVTNTASLQEDNVSDLSACGITQELRGIDGFFAVQMNAGERWHFHVHGTADQDLSLYLLSTCDPRSCVKAVDRCPKGQDEHMSVVAPSAGQYYVGIDGLDGPVAPGAFTLLAVKPVCGDGKKVHSEGCDFGDVLDGDGCDSRCRLEIAASGSSEAEPNGDNFSANVIRMLPVPPAPAQPGLIVKGQIGGPCDTDVFSIQVPAGATLRAILRNELNAPCTADLAPVGMKITDSDGAMLVAGAPSVDSGTCPTAVYGPVAAAGEYYVSFATVDNSTTPFKYQLEFQLTK